ncbi:peptidase membrane zinc metallopeptidase [Brachyspira pilosicoli WesB]|uniref:Peptidase membrane zinc metallopeptidase n=1 Tax=Brachyspira pilosicoli WesB TaxID=1161918 RepID=K0JF96_BRAPL|nr:zinc metallopeptidase [Brachyspira pilosicoli]CCG56068.1 peptidase membrane zinc metallopeptidase [Brachyspira pilosicoli WesB]
MFGGYFEYYFGYIWILIPGILLGLWAQMKVNGAYSKYSRVENKRGITGAQTAKYILDAYGLNIPIERINGHLTDHYDPSAKVLRLSNNVYNGTDVAALGIAAHEVGHAIQHDRSYAPLTLRNSFYPLCAIGNQFGPMLVLIGIVIGGAGSISQYLMMGGIILFSFAVLFSLITLPVEFDASNRAIKILDKGGFLDSEELYGARKVLNAAALTYVAAAVTAVLSLLRLLMLANRRRD